MTSTSISNHEESPILEMSKLNLAYNLDFYHQKSIRDLFIKTLKSPLKFLAPPAILHSLKDINIKIYKGDCVGVVGKNGSGKTSLCRVIAGMLSPQSGRMTIKGTVRSIFNSSVGIIPELTGRENALLLASLIYPHVDNDTLFKIIEDSINFSDLRSFIDTPFMHYSKGMQARLCLSVISALPSDLLILDEVYDGADTSFKEKISQRVNKMINDSGAVIFVSHDLEQIRALCNKIIILNEGQVLFYGSNLSKGFHIYNTLLQA